MGMKILIGVVLIAVVFGLLFLFGKFSWSSKSNDRKEQLISLQEEPNIKNYSEKELRELPAPVQRYFRNVLKDGQPIITKASLQQKGKMYLSEEKASPFTADQIVTTNPPGFLWNADVAMMPVFSTFVHDAYINGLGILQASLIGIVNVVHLENRKNVGEGELYRYLAEGTWYPTALLPSQGVEWKAVDDSTAIASLRDNGHNIWIKFYFNEDNEVYKIYTPNRPRDVKGKSVKTPWLGTFSNYTEVEGIKVPQNGEISWIIDGKKKTYWKGENFNFQFEYAE